MKKWWNARYASMWPQSFNCGNLRRVAYEISRVTLLQCGRSLSTAEIGRRGSDSEAYDHSSLQCGRSLSTAEMRHIGAQFNYPLGASMWPQSFNCGNAELAIWSRPRLPSFNVAAVFQLRKSEMNTLKAYFFLLLQCGRSLSTAEIRPCRPLPLAAVFPSFNVAAVFQLRKFNSDGLYLSIIASASMWPQSFNCGNRRL